MLMGQQFDMMTQLWWHVFDIYFGWGDIARLFKIKNKHGVGEIIGDEIFLMIHEETIEREVATTVFSLVEKLLQSLLEKNENFMQFYGVWCNIQGCFGRGTMP